MKQKNPYQLKRDNSQFVEDNDVSDWLEDQHLKVLAYASYLEAQAKSLRQIDYKTSILRSSSPVDFLTNIVVDILLILKESYKEGVPKTERSNPIIIFDYGKSGPLGNPAQTTRNFNVESAWSPQLAAFAKELTIFFSRSLKKGFTFQKEFVHLTDKLKEFLPPGFIPQKSKNAEKIDKKKKGIKTIRRDAYHRRRRFNK